MLKWKMVIPESDDHEDDILDKDIKTCNFLD